MFILGEFVNIKLTYQSTTGQYGKVGGQYLLSCLVVTDRIVWIQFSFHAGP